LFESKVARDGWMIDTPARTGPKRSLDVWNFAQDLTALLRAPEVTDDELRPLLKLLDAAFDKDHLIEANNRKYGFVANEAQFTQAEPGLWIIAAIALAAERPGLLDPAARAALLERLKLAQEHLATYYDRETGGWNTFPNQTDPKAHTTYTAALALLALLELHDAKLPWGDTTAERDRMLHATAHWLADKQWVATGDPPGWRAAADDEAPPTEGLTMQIYSELLRAEARAGFVIRADMLDAIPRQLLQMGERSLAAPTGVGRISRVFTNHEGRTFGINPAINYLWHPWAVETAQYWLDRPTVVNGPRERRTQLRRVLAHLVIDLGREQRTNLANKAVPPFTAAETLYGFSRLPPP
jgi:hypothetical protein